MNHDAIIDYYTAKHESVRLGADPQGRLELIRTRELLARLVPASPATVLDVGGATGVYAGWLASRGHRVHVVDPVPAHVAAAAALPGVTASLGDARSLEAAEDSFDVVLLMGPLYHLTERVDRIHALTEAHRVVRPGGLVAGAVISRYAGLLDYTRHGDVDATRLALIMEAVTTGRHDGRIGFMAAHLHTGPEAVAEFTEAGLRDPAVYGIEGPAWPTAGAATSTPRAEAVFNSALLAARAVEADPAMHPFSAHLLVTAHR